MLNIITQRKIYKLLYKKRQIIFCKHEPKNGSEMGWGTFLSNFATFSLSLSPTLPHSNTGTHIHFPTLWMYIWSLCRFYMPSALPSIPEVNFHHHGAHPPLPLLSKFIIFERDFLFGPDLNGMKIKITMQLKWVVYYFCTRLLAFLTTPRTHTHTRTEQTENLIWMIECVWTVIRLVVTANCQNGMNVSTRISRLWLFSLDKWSVAMAVMVPIITSTSSYSPPHSRFNSTSHSILAH